MLLAPIWGACSDSGKSTQDAATNDVTNGSSAAGQGSTNGAQNGEELPPIDSQAIAFLEVSFTIKGANEGAPGVPFEIRWEVDGKPSSTDVKTAEDGTRRIQFEHGSRLVGFVIHPSGRTAPSMYKESALLMGGRTHKVHVELDPGGIVSGVVLDIDGQPVPNAEVGAFFIDPIKLDTILLPSVDSFTRSDAQGRFRLGGFPAGHFIIEASVPNMVSVWRPGGVMSDAREFSGLEILLEPAHVVYGQAIDANEDPVADAMITAGKPNRRVNRRPTQYPEVFLHGPRASLAKSDADGLFTLGAVPESQTWNINGKHLDYLPVRTSFDAGQADIWLEFTKGVALSGSVSDGSGNSLVSAQIWLLSSSGQPSTFSDKNGDFKFKAGKEKLGVSLLAFKEGHGMFFIDRIDVVADSPALDIVLDGGVTISGKVVDAAGNGLSGVPVRIAGPLPHEGFLAIQMPERFLDRDAVLTGPDGSFEFNELYDSVFTVTTRPPGKPAVSVTDISSASADVVLTIE